MKKVTPYRIHRLNEFGYDILRIEILQQKYKSDFMPSFEPIGIIQFQKNQTEDNYFSGMRYSSECSYNSNSMNTFNKIVNLINKFCTYDSQPSEIIKFINGVEYQLIHNEITCVNDIGKYRFDVNYRNNNKNSILRDSGIYAYLIANDLNDATKKLNKIISSKTNDFNVTLSIGKSILI